MILLTQSPLIVAKCQPVTLRLVERLARRIHSKALASNFIATSSYRGVLQPASYHTLSNTKIKESRMCLTNTTNVVVCRQQMRKAESRERKDITISKEKPFGELSTSQKVARAGKDATYTAIVIGGLIVTGGLFFAIGRELFSGQSPSGIYGRALKLCRKNDDIIVILGEPVKGYGETTRRGRRRHVSHMEYMKDGVKHMRMQFYIEGPHKKGTVHLECQENESGKYDFRYLYVVVDDYPPRTIVLEDNRYKAQAEISSV